MKTVAEKTAASSSPTVHAPRIRWWRRVLLLLLLMAAALAAAPYALGWAPLRKRLIGMAFADTELQVSTAAVRLGWFSPITIHGLQVRAENERLLSVEAIETKRTLLEIISRGTNWGKIRIVAPHVDIVVTDGRVNLAAFKSAADEAELIKRLTDGQSRSVDIAIERATVSIRSSDDHQPAAKIGNLTLNAHLEKDAHADWLQLEPATLVDHFEVSPAMCDAGLKFVAPILADTTWVQGEASLVLDACRIELNRPHQSHIIGRLTIHNVRSGLKNPIVREIAAVLARVLGSDFPTSVRLADESIVQFELSNGRVTHDGLAFGLPDIAPELQIRSHGSVGLDETLEMLVEIPLPFERLGSGPLATVLGQQTIEVPIGGTLSKPRVEFRGNGKLLSGVLGGLVDELTDPETTDNLTEQLKALRGNLRKRLEDSRNNGPRQRPTPSNPAEDRPRFWRLRRLLAPADDDKNAPAEPPK